MLRDGLGVRGRSSTTGAEDGASSRSAAASSTAASDAAVGRRRGSRESARAQAVASGLPRSGRTSASGRGRSPWRSASSAGERERNGFAPVIASYSITPIDQMSAAGVGVEPVQISGAMYESVPSSRSSTVASGPTSIAMPKSASCTVPSPPSRMFAGLMSRWTMPCAWAWASPAQAAETARSSAASPSACARIDAPRSPPVDELGDHVDVVVVAGAVEQAHDVRVVEAARHLDLARGAAAQGGVVRDRLDGDVPVALAVEAAEHGARAADPDHGLDQVSADDLAGREQGRRRIGGRGSSGGAW